MMQEIIIQPGNQRVKRITNLLLFALLVALMMMT